MCSYCPPELSPQVETVGWNTDVPYFDLFPKPLIDLKDKSSLRSSIRMFAQKMNSGPVNDFLKAYGKEGAPEVEESFIINAFGPDSWYLGHQRLGRKIKTYFYGDGEMAFVLGYKNKKLKEPLWLATTSFNCGSLVSYNPNLEIQAGLQPIIIQLQGISYDDQKLREQAVSVFSRYRWERALIQLVIAWAREENIQGVYLLPASLNKYKGHRPQNEFYLRYDVTAQRCGFNRQRNGLYGFSLLPEDESVECRDTSLQLPGGNLPKERGKR